MYLKLKSIRMECGGCPTNYTGETIDGRTVDMYLRHGGLSITVDGRSIVRENPMGLDGVCNVDDFIHYAAKNGHILNIEEAVWSSRMQEIEELFADQVWVTFVQDFKSVSAKKTFKKGEKFSVSLNQVEDFLETGIVVVESASDLIKLKKKGIAIDKKAN